MSKKIVILVLFIVYPSLLQAQNLDQILQYSLEYPSYDAVSLVVPAVSQSSGFGGYQDNPASMALVDKSYFSVGLSNRYIDDTSTYLDNKSTFSSSETNIGDLGFIYKVPTVRGSMVVGGGYSQSTDFNKVFRNSGYNSSSTITDLYAKFPKSVSLNEAAYNTFAIEDVNNDSSVSILRFGDSFSNYPGINQHIELVEKGVQGEYSLFLATEVLKDMFLGGAIGYSRGTYTSEREFLESDQRNNYDGQFIDVDGDGQFETDIDNILSIQTIETELQAFQARVGIVYKPIESINVGISYKFPSVVYIDERFTTSITTSFDDGTKSETVKASGNYYYDTPSEVKEAASLSKIYKPAKVKGGMMVAAMDNFSISIAAEYTRYSKTEIDFEEPDQSITETRINRLISSSFENIINLRMGLEYAINEQLTPRLGYAYMSGPRSGIGKEKQFINGGFTAELTEGLLFDLGVQFSFWEEENVLYKTSRVQARIAENVSRLHVMASIRMTL
ncbi:outer membrane protein transport protein [Fodinibius saliphilus]|uniref:outer membrane protein transport protein n=1 Tax=Fodinibius saliphilus TaxID=1920650 RepID=UPI001109AA04|nr:outer membrane protein transport protein [Fodinibius saliphilus]